MFPESIENAKLSNTNKKSASNNLTNISELPEQKFVPEASLAKLINQELAVSYKCGWPQRVWKIKPP